MFEQFSLENTEYYLSTVRNEDLIFAETMIAENTFCGSAKISSHQKITSHTTEYKEIHKSVGHHCEFACAIAIIFKKVHN